ncbi:MAG: hypothetical protein JXR76_14255 [Deltaproteobacteria bacterium]|nr:hypothetical protein [Deltaproteobacteria bacterium]
MTRILCLTGVCLLAMACGGNLDDLLDDAGNRANAAIDDLEASDADLVSECLARVPQCADGNAKGNICQLMEEQCLALGDHLEDVRGPSVSCWQDVADCADAGADDCGAKANDCDANDDDMVFNREPLIDCFGIVEFCLVGTVDGEREDPLVCAGLLSQCDDLAKWVIAVEAARFYDSPDAYNLCVTARQQLPVHWVCPMPDGALDTEMDTMWSAPVDADTSTVWGGDGDTAAPDTGWCSCLCGEVDSSTEWSGEMDTADQTDTGWEYIEDTAAPDTSPVDVVDHDSEWSDQPDKWDTEPVPDATEWDTEPVPDPNGAQ